MAQIRCSHEHMNSRSLTSKRRNLAAAALPCASDWRKSSPNAPSFRPKNWRLRAQRSVFSEPSLGATSAIALFVALIVTLNTLLMSVVERTREFGIYSSVGWKPSRIVMMVLLEGVALSLIGGVAGAGVGWLTVKWIASRPYLMAIETTLDPGLLAAGALAIVCVGIVGSLYPAWAASRVKPAHAVAS